MIAYASKMYKEDPNRGQTPIDVLKRAAGALRQSGKLRQSAREFNVSKTTLKLFVDLMSIDENTTKKSGYKRVGDRHRIFFGPRKYGRRPRKPY